MQTKMSASNTRAFLHQVVVVYLDYYVRKLRMSLENMLGKELLRHPTAQEAEYDYLIGLCHRNKRN